MAVRGQARVEINREALHDLDLAMAKGLEALAFRVLLETDPPDATPYGEGLVDRGGFVSYVDGKRVGASQADARKPRAFRVRGQGASVAVGYGFPGRFQELGTERQPPRPFLSPAVMRVVGDEHVVGQALRAAMDEHLTKKRRRLLRYGIGQGITRGRTAQP